MKKRNNYFVPTIYLLVLFIITIGAYFTKRHYDNVEEPKEDAIKYVSNSIFSRTIPVLNVEEIIRKPFSDEKIEIARYFYNINDDLEKKEKSIVYYNGTYMPNTGVDYILDSSFDVLAIYDGTVVDTLDDELLGKTVKIRHNNDIISVYQGLENFDVKKGDMVFTNQKIGVSGTNRINEKIGNHLHFEIYKDGKAIDPENCYNKNLGDI